MNLGDMVNFVCRLVGKTDSATMTFVKDCIKIRYRIIWDACAWKDTQFVTYVPSSKLAINNDMAATQYLSAPLCELFLPSQVSQVLGIRYGRGGNSGIKLDSYDAASIFSLDPSVFTELGNIMAFSQLEPSATRNVVGGKFLRFYSSNAGDTSAIEIEGNSVSDHDSLLVEPTTRRRETLVLNGITPVNTSNSYTFIYTISKPATTGTIFARENEANTWMVELYPEENSRRYIHLMIHRSPGLYSAPFNDSDGVFFILGKRQFYDISTDIATPVIRGIENCLIEYATADLWEKMRQFSKSQLKASEGERLLQARMQLEREQSGIMQIVPTIDPQFASFY